MFGRRLYFAGLRIHHGLVGCTLILAGAALVYHDRRDWPFPLRERVA